MSASNTSDGSAEDVAIRVLPSGLCFTVADGETVLGAARRHGLRWPSICNGNANCTLCYMQIEEGLEFAGPEGPGERERLCFAGRDNQAIRLACQTRPQGPLIVTKKGVRPIEPD